MNLQRIKKEHPTELDNTENLSQDVQKHEKQALTTLEMTAIKESKEENQTNKLNKNKEKKSGILSKIKSSNRKIIKKQQLPRDAITIKIEKILEKDLKDAYAKLPPINQQEFKIAGEETSAKIRDLMRGTKVKIKKIFQLIFQWLQMLPNANKFFLEQEAKIKTDHITTLKEKENNKNQEKII